MVHYKFGNLANYSITRSRDIKGISNDIILDIHVLKVFRQKQSYFCELEKKHFGGIDWHRKRIYIYIYMYITEHHNPHSLRGSLNQYPYICIYLIFYFSCIIVLSTSSTLNNDENTTYGPFKTSHNIMTCEILWTFNFLFFCFKTRFLNYNVWIYLNFRKMTAWGSCMGYMSSTQLHESFMKFLLSNLETSWGPLLANSTTATAPKLVNQVQHAPFFCFLLTWWSKAAYINQPLWIPSSFCIASLPQAESIVHI